MGKISNKQLAKYAADQLQQGVSTKVLSRQVAALLVSERRSRDALVFARALEVELNARGITLVTLISAYAVGEDVKRQIATMLNAQHPIYNEVLDPQLLGGVHAATLYTQVDLTVLGQLNSFKRKVNEE